MRTKPTYLNPAVCPRCHRSAHPGKTCGQVAGDVTPAESLYEAYISARIARARRTLTAAKVAFLRNPLDAEKRRAVVQTEANIRRLQEQLNDPSESKESAVGPAISDHATPAFRARQAAQAETAHAPRDGVAEPFLREDGSTADALSKRRE